MKYDSDVAAKFRDGLLNWAEENIRDFPWKDPNASMYEVFIAEFFLARTPAENVASVLPEFVNRYPSLSAIEEADQEELASVIEPLGFYNMRAEALLEIASQQETLPKDVESLASLPQVGPYVANATLCFALHRPCPIVDRHVVRIYRRVFGEAFPENDTERRRFAAEILPTDGGRARTYNLALLDFGAQVCQSAKPRCKECFASSFCEYASQLEGDDLMSK
jgi:A/G-specific adenine glycosylase